jgi:hypothetical protein
MMHQINNERRQRKQQLTIEENRFPQLQQTAPRRQSHARYMARIMVARNANTWSQMQKQLEKSNALLKYQTYLRAQAAQRAAAAATASKRRL